MDEFAIFLCRNTKYSKQFEIDMQICVPNKDKEDVINKVLVVLESITVNIDTSFTTICY